MIVYHLELCGSHYGGGSEWTVISKSTSKNTLKSDKKSFTQYRPTIVQDAKKIAASMGLKSPWRVTEVNV